MRLICLLVFLAIGIGSLANTNVKIIASTPGKSIIPLKIKTLEKLLHRKFTLREKIECVIVQKIIKRKYRAQGLAETDPNKQSTWSFILGSAAALILIIAFVTLALPTLLVASIPALAIVALWLGIKSRKKGKNFRNLFGILLGGGIILLGIIFGVMAIGL